MSLKGALKSAIDISGGERCFILKSPERIAYLHLNVRGGFLNGKPISFPLNGDLCWRRDFEIYWRQLETKIHESFRGQEPTFIEIVFSERTEVSLPHSVKVI